MLKETGNLGPSTTRKPAKKNNIEVSNLPLQVSGFMPSFGLDPNLGCHPELGVDFFGLHMNKIFLLALSEELPDVPSYCDDQVFFTGVGKTNAAIVASDLIKTYNPNLVVNLGTAGSFDKNLSGLHKCGTFINRDCHPEFHETIRYGTGLTLSTGDSFALQEKDSNADLADMEAYAIAQACKYFNVNFACYKYITDYIGSNSIQDWSSKVSSGRQHFLGVINDYI